MRGNDHSEDAGEIDLISGNCCVMVFTLQIKPDAETHSSNVS